MRGVSEQRVGILLDRLQLCPADNDDGLEVYYVDAFQPPIENYINYDPYADYCEKKGE